VKDKPSLKDGQQVMWNTATVKFFTATFCAQSPIIIHHITRELSKLYSEDRKTNSPISNSPV
jgi:hypothetical protein